ncbi:MAG: hypothetical protein H0U58_02750, partial [Chloroflexi bacterium]|nr:hypothetical protein [Chloroflexota bacterium]
MQRSGLSRLTAAVGVLSLILAACSNGGGNSAVRSSGTSVSVAPSTGAASAAASAPASTEPSSEASASAEPSSSAGGGSGEKGTVRIAINPWVGAEANVAVVKNLLEEKLGYTVAATSLAEEVAWPGFETGEIDVILENWGHPDLEQKYITDAKVAQDAGLNGVNGIIGWFVPEWMAIQYPDITDWNNLNKYADLFKTSESGDKGQFLGASPAFVQYD